MFQTLLPTGASPIDSLARYHEPTFFCGQPVITNRTFFVGNPLSRTDLFVGNPFLRTDFVGGLFEGPVIFLVPSDCFFWGSGFGKDVVLVKLFFFFHCSNCATLFDRAKLLKRIV